MGTEEPHVKAIREAVLSGELPTSVFRRLLQSEAGTSKYDLGAYFVEAFEPVNSVVWNIVAHWRYRENSALWDRRTDYELLDQVVKAGISLPWSLQHIEQELKRSWEATNESSKST